MAIYTERWPTVYALNTYTELELNYTQNIATNKTEVTYAVRVKKVNNYNDNWTPTSPGSYTTLTIAGTTVLNSARHNTWSTSGSPTITSTVVSGKVSITHGADGKKAFPYSLTFNPNVSSISNMPVREITGTLAVPNIPRVSKASLPKTSFEFGESVLLTTNRADGSFTHKVSYIDSVGTVSLSTTVGASASISVPVSRISSHTTSVSVPMKIRVITVSGGVDIGTHDIAVTVNVPASVIPTVASLSVVETVAQAAAVFPAENQFISGVSKVKATANTAAGSYSSTIVNYNFRVKEMTSFSATSTANNVTFGAFSFPSSGSQVYTMQVQVSDSRGRYSAWRDSGAFRVHAYSPPVLSNPVAYRLSEPKTTIQVARSYTAYSLLDGAIQRNTAAYKIRTRAYGTTTWTDNTGATNSLLTLADSTANLAGTYSSSSMWEVQAVLTDKLNTAVSGIVTVSTEFVTMEVLRGQGVGIGKVPSINSYNLEVGTGGIGSDGPITSSTLKVGTTDIAASGAYTRLQNQHGYIDLGPANTSYAHIYTDRPSFYFNKELLVLGHKVWHANNDGSGSGLDADLLDGKHASSFLDLNNVSLLPDAVNLNTLMTPGIYQRSSDAAVTGMANTPDNLSGYLEVFGTGTMVYQRWTSYSNNNIYIRSYYNTWGVWVNLNTNSLTGSSTNGQWVRLPSGHTYAWGKQSYSTSTALVPIPRAFTDTPTVTVTATHAAHYPGVNITGVGKDYFNIAAVDARNGGLWGVNSTAGASYAVHWHAFGIS